MAKPLLSSSVLLNDRRLLILQGYYRAATKKLSRELLSVTDFGRARRITTLKQIDIILKDLDKKTTGWVEKEVEKYYKDHAKEIAIMMGKDGFPMDIAFSAIDDEAVKALSDGIMGYYREAYSGVKRSSMKMLNEGAKMRVTALLAEGKISGDTARAISDRMAGMLKEGFVALVDKGGRRWSIEAYSNMLTRTMLVKTANQGAVNRLASGGYDLVQVSDHFNECQLCTPWENEILSISGSHPQYKSVDEAQNSGEIFHPNCYDNKTQVYTDDGWKFFKDVNGEKIFSLDPKTLVPEWQDYVKKISYHYDNEMYKYKSNSFDLMVTPNHSMFIGFNGKENGKKKIKYRLEEAKDCPKNFLQLRTVNWRGTKLKYDDDFIKLVGYFLAEGYVDKSGYSKKVVICQSKEKEMIENLLGMGFYRNGDRLLKTDRVLFNYFKDFGKANKKEIPSEFMGASQRQIRILLDAFRLGDGSTRTQEKKGIKSIEKIYFTSSVRLAEQIGELIIKVGNYSSFRFEKRAGKEVEHKNGVYKTKTDMWIIRENSSKHSYFNSNPSTKHRGIQLKKVDYNGFVYDVELPEHHVLLVRRNGKIAWSGNCRHRLLPYHEKLVEVSSVWNAKKQRYIRL